MRNIIKLSSLLIIGFIIVTLIYSCNKDIPYSYKVVETVYHNMSVDTVKQVKLDLVLDGSTTPYDSLFINEEILPGDSLQFTYRDKRKMLFNFYDEGGYFLTTISFKNSPPIKNNLIGDSEYAGYFSKRSNWGVYLVYIGNEKLLVCSRFKDNVSPPLTPGKMSTCNLDLLKSE